MAKIISFPPQPGKYEEESSDWFYEGATCKANAGKPDDSERNCPAFVKKFPEDKVTAGKCTCLLCAKFEVGTD